MYTERESYREKELLRHMPFCKSKVKRVEGVYGLVIRRSGTSQTHN